MNRRQMMMLPGLALAAHPGSTQGQQAQQAGGPSPTGTVQDARQNVLPDKMLLQDYHPKSIYKIPKTEIMKAKFPIIDVHCHARARVPEDVDQWIKTMDTAGVERTVVFSGGTGARFDEVCRLYSKYPDRFDVWCSFDLTGNDKPGFGPAAVKELERCHGKGAKGVGEITDKGRGLGGNMGTGPAGWGGRGGPRAVQISRNGSRWPLETGPMGVLISALRKLVAVFRSLVLIFAVLIAPLRTPAQVARRARLPRQAAPEKDDRASSTSRDRQTAAGGAMP